MKHIIIIAMALTLSIGIFGAICAVRLSGWISQAERNNGLEV